MRRVAEKQCKSDDPDRTQGTKRHKGLAPAACAESGEIARNAAAHDNPSVDHNLVDGKRRRPRLDVELADERRIGRRKQRLSRGVHHAVCDNQHTYACGKAGAEDSNGKERSANDDHPLAAEEIGNDATKGNRHSEHERKRASDESKLRVSESRACKVRLYLRQDGIEYLPRPLRKKVRCGDDCEQNPLVVLCTVLHHCRLL